MSEAKAEDIKPEGEDTKTDRASIGEKSTHSQNSGKSSTSLESLRAEVDSVESGGHNTAYDRMYMLPKQLL